MELPTSDDDRVRAKSPWVLKDNAHRQVTINSFLELAEHVCSGGMENKKWSISGYAKDIGTIEWVDSGNGGSAASSSGHDGATMDSLRAARAKQGPAKADKSEKEDKTDKKAVQKRGKKKDKADQEEAEAPRKLRRE